MKSQLMTRTQSTLFRLLASDSPEWSENIIVLGKGIYNWSRRYKGLVCCLACVGESGGFLRLYPAFPDDKVEPFDVIQVVIRHDHPDKRRHESRKIYPQAIQVVAHEAKKEQPKILKSLCRLDAFLHGDEWRKQSLGVIRPRMPHFRTTKENRIWVHYKCGWRGCKGHRNEVRDLVNVDKVGRWRKPTKEKVEKFLSRVKKKRPFFVMGTMVKRPQRWIIIAIHSF